MTISEAAKSAKSTETVCPAYSCAVWGLGVRLGFRIWGSGFGVRGQFRGGCLGYYSHHRESNGKPN